MSSDSGSIMREPSQDSGKGETSSSGSSSGPSLSGSKDSGIAQPDKPKAAHNDEGKSVTKEKQSRGRVVSKIVSRWKKTPKPTPKILYEKSHMEDKKSRLQTFLEEGWVGAVSIELLADAGFYFHKERGVTMCYKCNIEIFDWRKGDQPKKRHKKLFPNCEVVKHYGSSNKITFDAKISSPAYTSEDIDDGRQGLSNPSEFYKKEFNRLVSYIGWPLSIPVDRYDLASTGLYSVRDHRGSDAVKCFACYIVIKDWKLGDRPQRKHAILSPSCPLVKTVQIENGKLTDDERIQIASVFRKCDEENLTTNPLDLKDEEGSSEKTFYLSETVRMNPFFLNALYPQYYHESKRLQSFQEWPPDHCQQAPLLAGAGLFSTGREDEVQCFYCGGKLVGWEPQDIPLTEHTTYFPTCKWALKRINQRNAEEEEAKFEAITSSSDHEGASDIDTLIEELEKLQERSLCKVCLDGDADILFLPCKHLAVCKECTERLELCPMCRSDIDEVIHVFLS
ncbi:Baculoviral IAP repeat-containing protein 7-B [Holothuria leucospilota]|uniref:Baculoviral IAP repeat-containing protein 7-B n=1 Tax=Holothuria leucospilota TaxID=206669 RepID=A0A9Q1BHZ6_HOLLE|nr:Baculoviral IAP repeat-containing protein 7-B [Holothuria leucospilota]